MFSQSALAQNLVLNCSFVLRSLSHLHVATKGQLAANFSLIGSIILATHVHVSVHAFICSSTQKWSSFIVSALVLAVQQIK